MYNISPHTCKYYVNLWFYLVTHTYHYSCFPFWATFTSPLHILSSIFHTFTFMYTLWLSGTLLFTALHCHVIFKKSESSLFLCLSVLAFLVSSESNMWSCLLHFPLSSHTEHMILHISSHLAVVRLQNCWPSQEMLPQGLLGLDKHQSMYQQVAVWMIWIQVWIQILDWFYVN